MSALVLASASPRRRELLARAGVVFAVEPSDADEAFDPTLSATEAARAVAARKAAAVAARHADDAAPPFVLGADTMVVLGEDGALRVLDKPEDEAEAARTLRALSGTRHRVVTGLAVVDPAGALHGDAETTWVTMRAWSEAEVAAYVESGEWRDKAGGYAIQESADRFVTALEGGGFDNVVGLPVARALALLEGAGYRREI